jgi:hypothetical protein
MLLADVLLAEVEVVVTVAVAIVVPLDGLQRP